MASIVHFGKYYPPERGGIESVTRVLAAAAAAQGHDVAVVCFGRPDLPRREVREGVKVFRTPAALKPASQPVGLRYLLTCLRQARGADVVHVHTPNMVAALCALLVGPTPKLLVHWHSDVINKGLLGRLLQPLEHAMLARADCIVASSPAYAQSSAVLKPFSGKVTVIPYGVPDVAGASPGSSAILPSSLAQRLHGKRLVLAVGRLVPYKGFDVLIEAARFLEPDALVVIVGSGPLKGELEQAVQKAGVADRVVMAGNLDDAVMHQLFARADVYCLPSVYRAEAFGVVLLEAMAHGVPIVASDIEGSGVPWVNQHMVSGINVPVRDARALADACNRILRHEQERAQLSQGARRRFLTDFTESVFVRNMMRTYARLSTAAFAS